MRDIYLFIIDRFNGVYLKLREQKRGVYIHKQMIKMNLEKEEKVKNGFSK